MDEPEQLANEAATLSDLPGLTWKMLYQLLNCSDRRSLRLVSKVINLRVNEVVTGVLVNKDTVQDVAACLRGLQRLPLLRSVTYEAPEEPQGRPMSWSFWMQSGSERNKHHNFATLATFTRRCLSQLPNITQIKVRGS